MKEFTVYNKNFISFSSIAEFYEWTSWSACGAGCAGERSRVCRKSTSTSITKNLCSSPEYFVSQVCDEENCGKESKSI